MLARTFVILGLIFGLAGATAHARADSGLEAALAWLASAQRPDGGFSGASPDASDAGTTADVVSGLAAAGVDPRSWTNMGRSPLDFLEEAASASQGFSGSAGLAAKVVLAAQAVGENPRQFGAQDLVASLLAGFDPATGLFGSGPFDSALALAALGAAGEAVPEGAVEGLLSTRLEEGSYSFSGDLTPGAGDSNTTAMAVLGLMAVGRPEEVSASLEYFHRAQNEDGGWTYQKPSAFGEETDANSTSLVMLALDAAGEAWVEWSDPLQALLALQQPDGSFAYNASTPGANLLATVQAIPALAAAARQPVPATETASPTAPPSETAGPTGVSMTPAATSTPEAGAAPTGGETALVVAALVVALGVAWWLGRRSSSEPS
ncbi:MAG: prenyltransferase/squalene oxidase repeat-containing protein [Anaerolineales bacterium]